MWRQTQHLWEFVPTDVGAVETVREILECILPVRARLDRERQKSIAGDENGIDDY